MSDWGHRAGELSDEAIAAGEPTAWFERLYAEASSGAIGMPWSRTDPHPELARRAATRGPTLDGRAVVVGCGLAADVAFLAAQGWTTTGFDLSPSAIAEARRRHPALDLHVADLTDLPREWAGAFDLVVEIFTLQAVKARVRPTLATGVRSLLAPGGRRLAIQYRHDGSGSPQDGPPFAQTRDAMLALGQGLRLVSLDEVPGPLWVAEYTRDGDAPDR
ncbi:class I SAM-dependent methyltransferase [Janibacter terrae]|uniref:class I SAM-dependent methyltransferase n=1 Tax=Janibacter terrae TaxID=103817 RepID=UPI00380B463D